MYEWSANEPLHSHDVTSKQPIKMRNLEPLSICVFFFLFSLACERIFIKTHSIERCVIGPENRLFAVASVQLSDRKFYRPGQ